MIDLFYHLLAPGTSTPETLSSQGELKLKGETPNSTHLWTACNLERGRDSRGRDIVRIIAYAGNGKTTTLVKFTRRNPDNRSSIMVWDWVQHISKISRFLFEGARTLLVDHATGVLSRIRQVAAKFDHKSSVKIIIAQLVKMDNWGHNMNPVMLDIWLNQVSLEYVNFESPTRCSFLQDNGQAKVGGRWP